MRLRPDVVGACGRVIADGANGPGIAFDDAVQILEAATTSYKPEDLQARMGLYGCNMAYRVSATGGLRFDEGFRDVPRAHHRHAEDDQADDPAHGSRGRRRRRRPLVAVDSQRRQIRREAIIHVRRA